MSSCFNYPQLCWHSDDVVEPVDAASSAFRDILNDFHLHRFIYQSLQNGQVPADWRHGSIFPLHKKGSKRKALLPITGPYPSHLFAAK